MGTGSRGAPLDGPWPPVQLLPPEAYDDPGPDVDLARVRLNEARACEPELLMTRRRRALAEAERLAVDPGLLLEVRAERALDYARDNQLDEAELRATALLRELPAGGDPLVRGRALEALGRSQAWRGDRLSGVEAAATLEAAVTAYGAGGATEWAGFTTFWLGNTVYFQRGALREAETLITRGLDLLAPTSPRRPGVLTFLSDVLAETGRWPEVDLVLAEASRLAASAGPRTRAYVAWSQARTAALRADELGTLRLLREVERNFADWTTLTSGPTFLADAAVMCERVGEHDAADAYLARALVSAPDDEFVRQARADLLARRGDPEEALRELRALRQAPWLETRELWRHALLSAWASLRARHGDVGRLAAQAFELAAAGGGPLVALTGEPELARALAPAAAAAGSADAVDVLSPRTGLVVRQLGSSSLSRGTQELPLPTGHTGALVRLLAGYPAGLDIEQVLEALWPDTDLDTGRRQLRGLLARLRRRVGDVVVREGPRLRLAEAWVDLVVFEDWAARALAGRDPVRARLALALWGGTPLPADPYEPWAVEQRERLVRTRRSLLDLLTDAAVRAGEVDEATALLEQALESDPYDESRYERAAALLEAAGRPAAASHWRQRAVRMLGQLV